MSFFESEIVKEEIAELLNLGKKISENLVDVSELSHSELKERIKILQLTLDKTKIVYTRLCLTDDLMAKQICQSLQNIAKIMSKDTYLEALIEVQELINNMKNELDR
jgi:hypothetical protein